MLNIYTYFAWAQVQTAEQLAGDWTGSKCKTHLLEPSSGVEYCLTSMPK